MAIETALQGDYFKATIEEAQTFTNTVRLLLKDKIRIEQGGTEPIIPYPASFALTSKFSNKQFDK